MPRTTKPLTSDRVAAYLDSKGLSFQQDDAGNYLINVADNYYSILVSGDQQEILALRGTWHFTVPPDMDSRMRVMCDNWNQEKLWPKTYTMVDDEGMVQLRTEHNIDLEHGVSDSQLQQFLDGGFMSSMQFFGVLDAEFRAQDQPPQS